MSDRLKWEKSVEYAFLSRVIRANAVLAIGPLDGDAEEIGDTMFGAACRWVIIEFKGTSADIRTEVGKYATQADYVRDRLALSKMYRQKANAVAKKIRNLGNNLQPHDVKLKRLHDKHKEYDNKALEYKRNVKAQQSIVFADAREALADRGAKFHFLVFGGAKEKDGEVERLVGLATNMPAQPSTECSGGPEKTLTSAAFELYMQSYFAANSTAKMIKDLFQIIPRKDSTEIGADGETLAAYLEDLISFKQTGTSSGGGAINEPNIYEGSAASLVGIDANGNLVVLPLEHVCSILYFWANKKKLARTLRNQGLNPS
jgi:hypothetical protein